MKLFRRKNEITLNRIHHTVIINENGEKLKLVVERLRMMSPIWNG